MATTYAQGDRVRARKYKVAELGNRPGFVETIQGTDIVVQFDGAETLRTVKASHIMADRPNGATHRPDRSRPQADEERTGDHPALDPNAEEITDEQVADLRAQNAEEPAGRQPSERQRLIAHLLDPSVRDHGNLEVGAQSASKASFADLRKWHANGHGDLSGGDHTHAV